MYKSKIKTKKWCFLLCMMGLFVLLVAGTFLFPKTYKSTFVIMTEPNTPMESNRVMTFNHPENYDLGITQTRNMLDANAYKEIVCSEQFLRPLLTMHVRTVDGQFDGTYSDYCLHYMGQPIGSKIIRRILESKNNITSTPSSQISALPWTKEEENVKNSLIKAINAEMDYETWFVTITCSSQDPLVSTMMATEIKRALLSYAESYQRQKMQVGLTQLITLTEQAKVDYEQNKTAEKEAIYKSFQRQKVVFEAQMNFYPAFTILSEPTFSYRKTSPSRWKMPLILTILIGLSIVGWEHKKEIKKYILS